eukprot:TRINITY_DN26364_c0_g1_i2.p1 TRINITY_DN26364_c0_g1~~TRINITY_DN26364_c0_g1_i2.p1  ORF type:complete len:251 (+),score=57.25 TRINITY_DN26364_c0_g1_i2:248-1000(+)
MAAKGIVSLAPLHKDVAANGESITLWWGSGSPPCWRVMITLEEKELSNYNSLCVNFARGEHKAPDIMAVNPRGQVPTMLDGTVPLCESGAACHYLASTYHRQGAQLFPTDPVHYAAALQGMYETDNLSNAFRDLYKFQRLHSETELDRDILAWGKEHELKAALRRELEFWEAKLSALGGAHEFIAGPVFTMADVFLFPTIAFFVRQGFKFTKMPLLATYYHHMVQRPSIQATWPPHWQESDPATQRLADV